MANGHCDHRNDAGISSFGSRPNQQEAGEFVSQHLTMIAVVRRLTARINPVRVVRALVIACFALLCGAAFAQSAVTDQAFDHATTGFSLSNQHIAARCESCHVQGVFRGTPRECSSCHRNASRPNATQFPIKHIPTTQQCDICHKSVDWGIVMFRHQGVVKGTCRSCHDGVTATGKSAKHIKVAASCDVCHNTLTWTATTFDHSRNEPGTPCDSCHNDSGARGKRANHIPYTPANAPCDTCHVTYTWYTTFNHSSVTAGSCTTCHNSFNAIGKPATHIPTTGACNNCHTNFSAFKPATMNHTGTAGQCSTCHSGAYAGVNAQAKSPNHVTTAQQCDTCHKSTTSWATSTFDHATNGVTVGGHTCSTNCHIAGRPGLPKPGNHIPTNQVCDICHTNFTAFAPATMSHDGTVAQCSNCHNGSYVSLNALSKPGTHVATTVQCDTCHNTVTWKPATYVHDSLAPRRCSNCHNGVVALGVGGTHIPDGRQCDTCHKNYVSFLPAAMDHTGLAGRCSTCHNGAYVSENAQTKSASHTITTAQCDTCHTSTTTWATATFNHSGVTIGGGTCGNAGCHVTGGAGLPKPTSHIPTTAGCDTCHTNFSSFKPASMNHAGTAGQCSTCHSGAYIAVGTIGAQQKPSTHIATTSQCDSCHNSTAWKPATYGHNGVTLGDHSCGTCHNGATATGKGATHIPDARACDTCHTSMSIFLLATMNHTGWTGKCSTCHGGAYVSENAQTKSASHVPTNAQCDSSGCHASTTTWATRTVNHALLAPPVTVGDHTCANCHKSGGSGLPKPSNHIPTAAACDTCHGNFTAFAPATMSHTGTTGQCGNCHNGSYTAFKAQAKPTSHIPTTASCDVCHRTTAWLPLITPYSHSGVAAGTCASCHIASYAQMEYKPLNHIPTTASCDACHRTTAWTPLITPYSHSGIAAGTCLSCHLASYALMEYKSATHIPTSASCEVCHAMTASAFKPARMNHNGTNGQCATCHNGSYTGANALGVDANHIPTTAVSASWASCDACHKSTTTFGGVRLHATVFTSNSQYPGTCAKCHEWNNPYGLTGRVPGDHPTSKPARLAPNSCDGSGCHSVKGF